MYEVILSSPGIDGSVKLDNRITCRTMLFLAVCVDAGLSDSETGHPLRKAFGEEDKTAMREFLAEALGKARLKEFYEKLKAVSKI